LVKTAQILITDRFLGGGFLTIGPELLWGEEHCGPLDRVRGLHCTALHCTALHCFEILAIHSLSYAFVCI
jgi:hypothetical protein